MLYPSVAMVENLTNCRYDGDVVKEFEKANATHVVCNSKVRKYLSLRFIDFYSLQTAVEIVNRPWFSRDVTAAMLVPQGN